MKSYIYKVPEVGSLQMATLDLNVEHNYKKKSVRKRMQGLPYNAEH